MDINTLKEKADAVQSTAYSIVKKHQMEMIVSLGTSNIEPLELKGMLKLINKTDTWVDDYEKALKR